MTHIFLARKKGAVKVKPSFFDSTKSFLFATVKTYYQFFPGKILLPDKIVLWVYEAYYCMGEICSLYVLRQSSLPAQIQSKRISKE